MSLAAVGYRAYPRSRYGIKALRRDLPPTLDEVMVDRLVVTIPGRLGPVDENQTRRLWEHYRHLLANRVQPDADQWSTPRAKGSAKFASTWTSDASTLSRATLTAVCGLEAVELALTVEINPTRTLRHLWQASTLALPQELVVRSTTAFFGASERPDEGDAEDDPRARLDFDEKDNFLPRVNEVRDALGHEDYPSVFLAVFEDQLKRWCLQAIAPASAGFVHDFSRTSATYGETGPRISMDWSRFLVSEAEVYFDRIHSDAVELMERVLIRMTSGDVMSSWRRHIRTEAGSRTRYSAVVERKPTKTIAQKFYAKTRSRVRCETQYVGEIRKTLYQTRSPQPDGSFFELLTDLRRNAVGRMNWAAFCNMAEEPPQIMLEELSDFLSVVADCCRVSRVNPLPVLRQILLRRSVRKTDSGGDAPERLIERLIEAGILEGERLSRSRPGDPKTYGVALKWVGALQRLQEVFAGGSGTTSPRTL